MHISVSVSCVSMHPCLYRLELAAYLFRAFPVARFSPSTPVKQPHIINYPNNCADHCCFDKPVVLMSCQAAELFDDLLLPKYEIQTPRIARVPTRASCKTLSDACLRCNQNGCQIRYQGGKKKTGLSLNRESPS